MNLLNSFSDKGRVFPQALKEEEEMLLQKRQIYIEEMNENEHLQKQMEICGQGLEMRLRDQGEFIFNILF